jgi:pimeloyl-ACP methyl ester carboxylesterase
MINHERADYPIDHQQIEVAGISVHAAVAGNRERQAILFLHGYPQNWKAFERVMTNLKNDWYVIAIDLPGVGGSEPMQSADKRSIAMVINELIDTMNLKQPVLAGHDIGGMITYSFLKLFPGKLSGAVIMNTAIPAIAPWEEVKRNPYIWHFALYAVPSLPEAVFTGKQKILFDYFYNTLSADQKAITEDNRAAYCASYADPAALKTSFDWYRAFAQDEKDNAGHVSIDVPVLYIRGDKDAGDIKEYAAGLKQSGLNNLSSCLIPHCGHFAADEQSEAVAGVIRDFVGANAEG